MRRGGKTTDTQAFRITGTITEAARGAQTKKSNDRDETERVKKYGGKTQGGGVKALFGGKCSLMRFDGPVESNDSRHANKWGNRKRIGKPFNVVFASQNQQPQK